MEGRTTSARVSWRTTAVRDKQERYTSELYSHQAELTLRLEHDVNALERCRSFQKLAKKYLGLVVCGILLVDG
jgi:hypothetical protein